MGSVHRIRWIIGGGLLAALLAGGCGPDYKKKFEQLDAEHQKTLLELDKVKADRVSSEKQAKDVGEQLEEARGEIADLLAKQGVPKSELEALQEQIAKLKEQLAKKPATAGDEWKYGVGIAMTSIPGQVLFSPGSAKLKATGRGTLESVAARLKGQFASMRVLVVGHTDSDPIRRTRKLWKDNYELSGQRALAVARYLIARGVAPTRVMAAGCGEHRPVAANTGKANKARNRRVEIYAYTQSPVRK